MQFPEVSQANITFGEYPVEWFAETLKQEFKSPENEHKYEQIVNNLFFHGGKIPAKEHKDEAEKIRILDGVRLFKAILGSFGPKYEQKVRVCALILEDLNS